MTFRIGAASRLRDERGAALIDAMAGLIVASIAVVSLSAIAVSATAVSHSTAVDGERESFLRTHLHELSTNFAALPVAAAAVPSVMAVDGDDVEVTVWRAGSALLATASRWSAGSDADCSNVTAVGRDGCLTVELSVDVNSTTISTVAVPAAWNDPNVAGPAAVTVPASALGTLTPMFGTTEVRYVLSASATSGVQIRFTDQVTGLVLESFQVPALRSYVYGTIPVSGANPITVNVVGGSATVSHIYIYEAPR
jgi:hypothetical protein